MAIYHLHVKNISRGAGRSAVAAAAYRAGEALANDREDRESDFSGRGGVVHSEIIAPDSAPAWASDRPALWNAVEAAEKRKDARLAKEVEFALPRELPRAAWLDVARSMAKTFVAKGHIVDLAVHDDGTGHNPHCHLMLTTREISAAGFGPKLRAADGLAFLQETRRAWAAMASAALAGAGIPTGIDPRSYAARGEQRAPTTHRGPDRAERAARRKGRANMETRMYDDAEREFGVPDPDGNAISPDQRDLAEEALLAEMARPAPPAGREPVANTIDLQEAAAAVERLNALPVSDNEAEAYRLATPQVNQEWWRVPHAERAAESQVEPPRERWWDRSER